MQLIPIDIIGTEVTQQCIDGVEPMFAQRPLVPWRRSCLAHGLGRDDARMATPREPAADDLFSAARPSLRLRQRAHTSRIQERDAGIDGGIEDCVRDGFIGLQAERPRSHPQARARQSGVAKLYVLHWTRLCVPSLGCNMMMATFICLWRTPIAVWRAAVRQATDSTMAQRRQSAVPLDFGTTTQMTPRTVRMLATLLAALAVAATLAGAAWLYLNRPGHGGLLFEIEQKLDKIAHFDKHSVDFDTLPLDDALRSVNGDGSRRIVVFSDPYCPYCKTLEHTLAGLPNVTVYTFLYPILTPDSKTMSARIWCASNRTGAWSAWMFEDRAPPPVTASCNATATVLARNLMLGRKLRMMRTPTLILTNGQRISPRHRRPNWNKRWRSPPDRAAPPQAASAAWRYGHSATQ